MNDINIVINNNNFLIRHIVYSDYAKEYLLLLKQLTYIDPEKILVNDFNNFIDKLNNNHAIIVIENIDIHKIVGTITIIIEQKIIHNMGKVCHIEDVVVHENCRGYGLGKILVDTAINYALTEKCYKTILDCSEKNVGFYKKNSGFEIKGTQMALYH
jgi:glucosamine-phosphate N-acetyltransferase